MVIFFEWGRLGNQLFQYCAMRAFDPTGSILAFGLDDLKHHFPSVALSPLSVSNRIGLFARAAYHFIRLISYLRLIGTVDEAHSVEGPRFVATRGLLRRVHYFRGLYQTPWIATSIAVRELRLSDSLRKFADKTLASLPGDAQDRYFVHVRRGDYIAWPTCDCPAVLPLEWYRLQMDRIRERNPDAVFVVASDDRPYVEEFLARHENVVLIRGTPQEDFAVMAACRGGGILSASSYSWWAAYFAHCESDDAYFIAPRFWLGHRSGAWDPNGIETPWIHFVDVDHPDCCRSRKQPDTAARFQTRPCARR